MSQLLDQLAKLAAQADAPALDDADARRLVDAALVRATLADARPQPRGRAAWPFAFAIAAAAVIAILALRPRPHAPEPALVHLALPTGDRLSGTAGVQFAIDELAPASRKLRLHAGTMVFEVAHVVAGQHFEVATRDAVVVATGTVFSVGTDDRGTHVHVYEGSVEIRTASRTLPLAAGADWQTASLPDSPQIVEAGKAAAHERQRVAATSAAVPPVPLPDPGITRRHEDAKTMSGSDSTNPSRHRVFALIPKRSAPVAAPARAVAPAGMSESAPAAPVEAPPERDELADARADIAAGRFADALAKSDAAPKPLTGAWLLLRADAQRALGDKREASDTLVAAAAALDGTAQAEAAYSAAYLRFHDLHDGDGALAALAAGDVDIPGSMFEERGLALHVQILVAQGKHADAKPLARRYLERFTRGELRALMTQEASK